MVEILTIQVARVNVENISVYRGDWKLFDNKIKLLSIGIDRSFLESFLLSKDILQSVEYTISGQNYTYLKEQSQ